MTKPRLLTMSDITNRALPVLANQLQFVDKVPDGWWPRLWWRLGRWRQDMWWSWHFRNRALMRKVRRFRARWLP